MTMTTGNKQLLAAEAGSAGAAPSVDKLIADIRNPDDAVRGPAWQKAPEYGAAAIQPLAGLLDDSDFEAARAAKRAMWKIVRHAGRPGAHAERKAVAGELVPLLKQPSVTVKREALWMLSELGGDDSVEPVAALLGDADVHDDARAALERIPGRKSLAALKAGLDTA